MEDSADEHEEANKSRSKLPNTVKNAHQGNAPIPIVTLMDESTIQGQEDSIVEKI